MAYKNVQYSGDETKIFFKDTHFMAIRLDFQSFYVFILLQLLERESGFSKFYDIMNRLNNDRLVYKQNNDPMNKTIKEIVLAVTGNLNYNKSSVYNPKLYYSMTANGQLILLELLHRLSDIICDVLLVNTDGLIVVIEKENYTKCMDVCDSVERFIGIKIDTRDEIEWGYFIGANKSVLKTTLSKKVEIKGFNKVFGFQFIPEVIVNWFEMNNESGFVFETSVELYESFFNAFDQYTNKQISVYKFLEIDKNAKGHFLLYFPKSKATHCFGYPKTWGPKHNVHLQPFATKLLYFQEEENIKNLNFIENDLNFSTYWHQFCTSTFKNSYFSSVNRSLHEKQVHGLNVNHIESFSYCNEKLNVWNRECDFFKVMEHFCTLSLYPFFKREDKKSFAGKEFKIKEFYKILDDKTKQNYAGYMLETYPQLFIRAAALTIDLEFTWLDSKIICLDCDDLQSLFEVNRTNLAISTFLHDAKSKNCVLFSSPTNTPFDRFKIMIQMSDIDCSYKNLQEDFQTSYLSKIFSLESFASVFGDNTMLQSIINPIQGLALFPMTSKQLFLSESDILKDEICLDELKNTHFKNLVSFFDERPNNERLIYNKKEITQKNIFHFDKESFDMNFFIDVFKNVVFKENVNKIYDENFLQFYQFDRNVSLKEEKKKATKTRNEFKKVTKKTSHNLKITNQTNDYVPLVTKEHVDIVKQLKLNKIPKLKLSNELLKKQYDSLFDHINGLYSTSFLYSDGVRESTEYGLSIVYHTPCIYDPEPYNKEQVTAFVSLETGFVNIHCYHKKCIQHSKYSEIACVINKHIFAFWDTYTCHIFTNKVRDIDELFDFN